MRNAGAWARLTGVVALVALTACDREVILEGQRLDLRADLGAADPVAAAIEPDTSRPISLPAANADTEWTHRAANTANAIGHRALSASPQLVWQAQIGKGNDRKHRITAEPVIANGRIFTVDSRATVTAHSLDGQFLWQTDLTPAYESPDDASGAGLAVSGDQLYVTTGFGFLAALDVATGTQAWRQEFDAAAAGAPLVSGGTVYAMTRDDRAWAVDAGNGRVDWTFDGTKTVAGVLGSGTPALAGDGTLILPFASTELVGVGLDGAAKWVGVVAGQRLGAVYARITDITGDPVVSGGTVYAGNPSGRTVALDATSGEQIWFAEDGAMSAVTIAGGSVFAVTDRNEIVRLDAATGDRIWGTDLPFFVRENKTKKRKAIYAHFGPILAGGQLWVASTDEVLRAFDPESGAPVRTVALPGGAATSPVVAGGVMYVVNAKGQLLAFR